jgi:diguanylate cyclase (GGDEF)-like protein
LKNISEIDQLTRAYNRRKFDERLDMEITRSKRTKIPFSLLMIDIDYFKKVNDEFGHLLGDVVLQKLSDTVKKNIRKEDTFARFGGEEFILILTNSNEQQAFTKAEQLRTIIRDTPFEKVNNITVSIGVSQYKENMGFQDILKYSDDALYHAKEEGRDRVCVHSNIKKDT